MYARRPGQSHIDLANAKQFEDEVRAFLPDYTVNRTNSSVDLDFYLPKIVVEVKEKRQKLTERWWSSTTTFEHHLFVLDELTVRKAMKHWPYVWFVLRNVPAGRIMVANVAEIISADRHRFDRNGKGKWVIDTSPFREIPTLNELMPTIINDLRMEFWKASCCLIEAPEV